MKLYSLPIPSASIAADPGKSSASVAVVLDVRTGRQHGNLTIARARPRHRVPVAVAVPQPEAMAASDARLERLLGALGDATEPVFRDVAAAIDLARYRSHVDVGGGDARLSCILAAREPRLASRSCDLPEIRAIAERRIRDRGLAARVRAVALDPYADEFPQADLITLGSLLHDWNVQRRKMLIAKAWRALSPGGALVAIQTIVHAEPRHEEMRIDATADPRIECGDVLDFAGDDFLRWNREAGFRDVEMLSLAGGARAVVATR